MKFEIHSLSEQSVSLYFEQEISSVVNDKVIAATKWIKENPFDGLREVVPAYASLTVFFDLLVVKRNCIKGKTAFTFVKRYLENIPFKKLETKLKEGRLIEIPVRYNGEDLAFVASHNKLSEKEVIALHTAPIYRVYMMGFLPGFAYLGGMDKRITTPRGDNPRLKVPAGSVGIAGGQTGIYPLESPGGWQLIGETDVSLFMPREQKRTLLETGDRLRFVEA